MLEDVIPAASDPLDRLRTALRERYAVGRELGRGGMGTVFLARDLRHERLVAIKVLHPELATSPGTQRFLSEIRMAANLAHPHIVTVFESGETGGLLYYVMPYVEGESLRDRMDRGGRLPLEEAVRIALDVAEALALAHRAGVVHRDIKPENILLGAHGHASLADFGVARAFSAGTGSERLTAAGLILGSPPYMSPEQADGAAVVDGRADLYSLGCVLHEMLAGEPPFGAVGAGATILRHLTQAPPPLGQLRGDVPPTLEAVVLKALEKRPEDRFATAAELAAALADRSSPQAEASPRRPPRREARRGRARVLAVLGGGVVLAALAAVGLPLVRPEVPALPEGPASVAVLPFDGSLAPGAAGFAREPQLELRLESALRLLPRVRVVSAQAFFDGENWRATALDERLETASRNGARYLLSGSLAGAERLPVVELHATRAGETVYRGGAQAGESQAQALDRIALEVVRAVAENEEMELGAFGELASATTSLTAILQLQQGQQLFLRGETDAAVEAYRRAIEADSSFGPAYYRLSIAETWRPRWDYPAALAAAEAGLRRADRMPPRWADLLKAQRHYARRSADSAIHQFEKVVGENPRLSDALLGAGEGLLHLSGAIGENPVVSAARFEALAAQDSTFAPIQDHLVEVALYRGDERGARRYLAQVRGPERRISAAAVALRFGGVAERSRALDSLRGADRGTITSVMALFVQSALNLPLADTLASFMTAPGRNREDRVRGAHYRLAVLSALGRWEDGVRQWESATGGRRFDPWIVHGYLAGHSVAELAEPMFAWAGAQFSEERPPSFAPLRGDANELERRDAFRALVHRATLEGGSREVRRLLAMVDAAAPSADASDPEPTALRASLRARLAMLAGDTVRAVAELEKAVARAPWSPSWYIPLADAAPQRLLLARLLAARRDRGGAERRLRSFGQVWSVGDAIFLPAVAQVRAGLPYPASRSARRPGR